MEQESIDSLLKDFGENLKKIRDERRLSLRQLSANCSIDYSDLAKIEKGQRNVTLSTVFDIAEGLSVPPKRLLDF